MDQRDYFMREIEKLGFLLRALLNSLAGKKENLAISVDNHFEITKGQLLKEIGFDIDEFVNLERPAAEEYVSGFKSFNAVNIELLADSLLRLSSISEEDEKRSLLEKSLYLYDMCNRKDRTFSFARKEAIDRIKENLISLIIISSGLLLLSTNS